MELRDFKMPKIKFPKIKFDHIEKEFNKIDFEKIKKEKKGNYQVQKPNRFCTTEVGETQNRTKITVYITIF